MTIKEMEARTGMDRANIRFYEREGLLAPRRLSNGYRDYSEQDAETLLRIKLLRSLHVPLEEIRALQAGARSLEDAMRAQLNMLEAEKRDVACAESVCRAIQADRAQFESLNAGKYLQKLSDSTPQESAYFSVRQDVVPQLSHPWRRFFARSLDLALCTTLWELLFVLGLRINPSTDAGRIAGLASTLLGFLTMLFLEPLLLRLFAATPGKALFGLRLTDADGAHLSYAEGLSRTWRVIWRGLGLNIPVYRLVRLWKCYKTCCAGETESWDDFPLSRLYVIRDTRRWRGFAFAAAQALLFFACFWAVEAASLPPNRGSLTVAEFAENFNYLCRYYDLDYNYILLPDGSWSETPQLRTGFLIVIGTQPEPLRYTTDGGRLIGVSLTAENENPLALMSTDRMKLIALSMVAAEPGAGAFSGAADAVFRRMDNAWSDCSFTLFGISVDYTCRFDPEDGDSVSYSFEMTKSP